MLTGLFVWLDANPWTYWVLVVPPTLLVTALAWTAVRREFPGPAGAPTTAAEARWDGIALFLFLLAWRWPFLFAANDFNPDESHFIAGAMTLVHDPVFWRSVDGATSGPLNFYILVPLHWLGLPLDYFTTRAVGLLLVWGSLFLCHRAIARTMGRATAWLAVLPAAGFFSTVTHHDFIHYSSEHVTLLLTAASAWMLATRETGDRRRLWAACILAGSAPWAKLQSLPITAILVALALWEILFERKADMRRGLLGCVIATATPSLIIVALVIASGQVEPAVRRYILQNMLYVEEGRKIGVALQMMAGMAAKDMRLPLFLATTAATAVAATVYLFRRRKQPPKLLIAGGLLSAAAIVALVTARREFLHYGLLLPIPITLLLGGAIGGWWQGLPAARNRRVLALVLLASGLVPVITRALQPAPEMFGKFSDHWRHPRSRVGEVVRALAGSGGSLAIWGWAPHLYVETGLRQGTRDTISVRSMRPGALQGYFRANYISDFRREKPPVFVDVSGASNFLFTDRSIHGHECFPELADEVRRNYALVRDLDDVRIYARNELPALAGMAPGDFDRIAARGRARPRGGDVPIPEFPMDGLQWKPVEGQHALFIHPPYKAEWLLDEDVRRVSLVFGFEPEAYIRGNSNGATIIVELADQSGTRSIFQKSLKPASVKRDRGPQRARLTLPRFSAGARLIIRTDPGEYGDSAWDWVYLGELTFEKG